MKIIFLGDVVGRSGRDAVVKYLPELKKTLTPDVVIVNGENSAHGVGITDKICQELYDAGTDCISNGNHAWDKREIMLYIDKDPRLLRPANFPPGTPGKGTYVHECENGRRILIVNLMGQLFMDPLDNPFTAVTEILKQYRLGENVHAILVDMHAEATSEKMAMGHFLDGKVSAVVGTHTHVPTGDAQILNGGTAYQTDAGMCGDYNSVIGMQIDAPIHRFTKKTPSDKLQPADGDGTICGIYVETNDATGLATKIEPIRMGPRLATAIPNI